VYVKEGPEALERWMDTQGAQNIDNVNRALRLARSWTEARAFRG
jgi:hypothetical protein